MPPLGRPGGRHHEQPPRSHSFAAPRGGRCLPWGGPAGGIMNTPHAYGLQRLYIGGAYVDATSGVTFDTFDPATGETLASVQQASEADIERAVQSAREGQR